MKMKHSIASAGLLCLAAAGPLWAQGGPGGGADSGQAARAGVGNQVTNPSQGIPDGAPGDDASFNDNSARNSDAMQQAYKDYSQKKFAVAVPELQAVLKKSPNTVEAHEMLASIYTIQNQFPQAIPELQAVVRLQPKRLDFRENLGKVYLQTGDTAKGAAEFQALLAQQPANETYAFEYATALAHEDKKTEAAAAFEKVAALAPKDSQAYFNAGILYHEAGNDAKAVPDLKTAVALGTTQKFNADIALAEAAAAAKQSSEAIEYYMQAAQANPSDFGAEANVGILEQNAGRKAEAEAAYRQALTLKNDDPQSVAGIQENLAGLLKNDGNLDEAATLLTQAAQVDSHNATIQIQLGAIYSKQNKKALALAAYNKALAINPNSAIAKDGVAQASKP